MWNNTRLLNLVANLMFALCVLIVAKLLAVAALNSTALPLRTVHVTGELNNVSREQLVEAFAGRTLGNFFSADLAEVRRWVETVPWVRHASVRRVWPDRLEVIVEAQEPIARWSDHQLVNSWGELFNGDTAAALPHFSGPQGTEFEVTDRYHRFRVILKSLGRELSAIALTNRYSWELTLTDGTSIALGRDGASETAEDRLLRVARIYPDTLAHLPRGKFTRLDLRYPNGFALRLPETAESRGARPGPPGIPQPARKPATNAALRIAPEAA